MNDQPEPHPHRLIDVTVHVGKDANHDRTHAVKLQVDHVSFWYDEAEALQDINLDIYDREVTAFIGPSGCGKSTLLRCLNRTNELIPGTRIEGSIHLDGEDIYDREIDVPDLRRRFGWVAQKPDPFPTSIYRNIAYGPHIHGLVSTHEETDAIVQHCLEMAGLWDEVKDRLDEPGTELSGGQQQRLCVARAISTEPEVILMDEPASALDPNATAQLEELIAQLRRDYCVIIVTHNMQQAARVSQRTAYFHLGKLIEVNNTEDIFMRPQTQLCRDYIEGRFG